MVETNLYSTEILNGYELTFTKMRITFRKKNVKTYVKEVNNKNVKYKIVVCQGHVKRIRFLRVNF